MGFARDSSLNIVHAQACQIPVWKNILCNLGSINFYHTKLVLSTKDLEVTLSKNTSIEQILNALPNGPISQRESSRDQRSLTEIVDDVLFVVVVNT